jgi:protein gp37
MGEKTSIGWCDHTFNPWIGCERVSPECDHCYADAGSRRLAGKTRLKLWDEGSSRYLTSEGYWAEPFRWNRAAERAGTRARVFCASYGDVFERRPELVAPRRRLQGVIEATPWLDWLLLSKRPENMVELASAAWPNHWPDNVWAGATAGLRRTLVERAGFLERVPARLRFLSMEPLLERVDVAQPFWWHERRWRGFDWVIVGSESGAHAREMDPAWAAAIVAACRAQAVPVFVKQLLTPLGKAHGDRKGEDPRYWPLGDWPRQWPLPAAALPRAVGAQ